MSLLARGGQRKQLQSVRELPVHGRSLGLSSVGVGCSLPSCAWQLSTQSSKPSQAAGMGSQQSLGGGPGDGGPFGNAMALNAGPPMGSVGSTQDLQDLYRRYSSMPMQPSPARMLSMHDSAGSTSLDEVGRSART